MRTGGCPLSPTRQARQDTADLKWRVEALEQAQADRLTPLRDMLSLLEESSRAELVYTVCATKAGSICSSKRWNKCGRRCGTCGNGSLTSKRVANRGPKRVQWRRHRPLRSRETWGSVFLPEG